MHTGSTDVFGKPEEEERMYVVTEEGRKLYLDDSEVDYENDRIPMTKMVALVAPNTEVWKEWVMTLCEKGWGPRNDKLPEAIAELNYDHYPTQEEMLWAFSKYGISPYGYAQINEVWRYGR